MRHANRGSLVAGAVVWVLMVAFTVPTTVSAWGWEAHRRIHSAALSVLPAEMKAAIAGHEESLIAHSVDPDMWKHDPDERHRHWFDVELADATPPYGDEIPRDLATALERYGADSLRKIGVLPWRIASYTDTVVAAMQDPTAEMWVDMAALGHYVADSYMPMHATVNYDGQFTGNRGIHFRLEWWMLEGNWDRIALTVDALTPVDDPLGDAWNSVLYSHSLVDSVLAADTALRSQFRAPVMRADGRPQADQEYDQRLFEVLGPLAEDRMQAAAAAVAGYWFYAWTRAGRPPLVGVPSPGPPPEE